MTEASTANGSGPVPEVPRGGIGSDFHSADLGPEVMPPWEQYYSEGSLTYFSTGRQALYALAEKLEPLGYNLLLVPDYFCESMLVSFEARGWNFVSYPLYEDLSVDWSALRELAQQQEDSFAVLVPRYFAPRADDCPTLEFQALQELGAFVIVDETHTVFNPEALAADAAIASLRKMLPVADGAYLWTRELEVDAPREESEAAAARWAAMDLKAQFLSDGAPVDFYDALRAADQTLQSAILPLGISSRSAWTLRHLDYTFMATRRRENFARVLECQEIRHLTHCACLGTPAFGVVLSHHAVDLQHSLAQLKIYCPVHWPQPKGNLAQYWQPRGILSLPVDHRYSASDIERIIRTMTDLERNWRS